jgi:hypothetical protein
MPDYHYSEGDDVIHATTALGFTAADNIFGGGGNDTVYLGDGVKFVSGPGNDTVIGTGNSHYAAWSAPKALRVNFVEGWADDGYGGRDQISGIDSLHMPSLGGEVIGSAANETVFVFGGNVSLSMGAGTDTVHMWGLQSRDYTIRQSGNTVTIKGDGSTFVLKDVESIRFSDTTITPVYAERNEMQTVKILSSFTETEISEGWWYAGVYNEPRLVSYGAGAPLIIDIGQDGDLDAIVPMSRGYRTGVDTRYSMQVFENVGGQLRYSEELTGQSPFVAGARRSDILFLERTQTQVVVTAAHDTTIETETRTDLPWRFGDLTFTNTKPFVDITQQIVSNTNTDAASKSGRVTAIDAHAMAVGDINGDGMDDVLVADFSGAFALLQTVDGPFEYLSTPLMKKIVNWTDPDINGAKPAFLLDIALGDVNGDGLADLVTGWGHTNVFSRVFYNDKQAGFTETNSSTLPESVYGSEQSLPLKNWIADLDGDGDNDLLIQHSRDEPYYGGSYLQVLINDGKGQFSDQTNTRIGNPDDSPYTYGGRIDWTDFWQLIDLNNDGALDIIGTPKYGSDAMLYLNDGTGNFTLETAAVDGNSPNVVWADFNNNGRVEGIHFDARWTNEEGTESINTFSHNELYSYNPPSASRAYDLHGDAGIVAKILGAVLGPAGVKSPDLVGIGLTEMDRGTTYDELLEFALDAVLSPARSNESLVRLLYSNITGVQPDQATIDSFVQQITSGQLTQVQLARLAADHVENINNIDLVGLALTGLDYIG